VYVPSGAGSAGGVGVRVVASVVSSAAGAVAAAGRSRRCGEQGVGERGEWFEDDELRLVEAVAGQRVQDAFRLAVVLGGCSWDGVHGPDFLPVKAPVSVFLMHRPGPPVLRQVDGHDLSTPFVVAGNAAARGKAARVMSLDGRSR
jgi:hypothetical protein